MTLFEAFKLIEFVCNKDYNGNIITPERFNMLIKVVSVDLFRKKYGIPEEYQPGRPVPSEYVDITLKNTDDLKVFKKDKWNTPVTNGILPYPSDYAHRDSIVYNFTKTINKIATILPRPIEILRDEQAADRRGNWTKRPTTKNPIGTMRSDGIYVYPATILSVDFSYFRFPVNPVFAVTYGDGFITEDSANSVQWEFTKDEHLTLVSMILGLIGVNLRESDLVQYAELRKQKGE